MTNYHCLGGNKKKKKLSNNVIDLTFAAGDLAWAKMEGHPWWPCLIIDHTKKGDTNKRSKKGRSSVFDVQFFGKTLTRGHATERFLKPFNGSDSEDCQRGGKYFSSDRDWKVAVQKADEAFRQDTDERLKLIVAVESSDVEDDDSDVMEVDDEKEDDMPPESRKKAKKSIKNKKSNGKSKKQKDVSALTPKQLEVAVKPEVLADSGASSVARCSTMCVAVLKAQVNVLLEQLASMFHSDDAIATDHLSYHAHVFDQMKNKGIPFLLEMFRPLLHEFAMGVVNSMVSVERSYAMVKYRVPKVLDFFSRNETLARTMDQLTHSLHNFFQKLLELGGNIKMNLLNWIGEVLHIYDDGRNIHHRYRGGYTDNLLINLQTILFMLFQPCLDDHSKLLEIQPSYSWATNERGDALRRNIHMREILTKFIIPSSSGMGSSSLEHRYEMTSEIFFMCQRCFDFGFSVTHAKFTKLNRELDSKRKRLKELEDQNLGDAEEARRLKTQLNRDFRLFLCYKAALTENNLLENAFQFMTFTAKFLVHISMTPPGSSSSRVYEAKFESPSVTSDRLLKFIPEFVLDNFHSFMMLLKIHKDDMFEHHQGRSQRKCLRSILDFLLLFISNPELIHDQYRRNEMAETLECLFPTVSQPNTNREKLLVKSTNARHLMTSIIKLFVGMELARHEEDMEKFFFIPSISIMMDYLCGIKLHRSVLKDLVLYAEHHIDTEDPPLFLRFIYHLTDDAGYYLDEAIRLMIEVRGTPDNEKQTKVYARKVELARLHSDMNMLVISTISHISSFAGSFIFHPCMAVLFANLIIDHLTKLVGPKWVDINNMQEFNFSHQWLLHEIITIFADFSMNNSFLRAFSSIESFKLLEKACHTLSIVYDMPEIIKIKKIKRIIHKFVEEKAEEEKKMVGAPKKFKDPITRQTMRDPVILPSRWVIDRMTLIRCLLQGKDPGTNQPLRMEMIEPDTELKREIYDARYHSEKDIIDQ